MKLIINVIITAITLKYILSKPDAHSDIWNSYGYYISMNRLLKKYDRTSFCGLLFQTHFHHILFREGYTIFAPDDVTIVKMYKKYKYSLHKLRHFVKAHIFKGDRRVATMRDGGTIVNLNGDRVFVNKMFDIETKGIKFWIQGINIQKFDLQASGNILHLIERPIIVPKHSVLHFLRTSGMHNIVYKMLLQNRIYFQFPFGTTFIAPLDHAFESLPARYKEDLFGDPVKTRTSVSTLEHFPETLLGDKKLRDRFYCPTSRQYFFDRNRKCFEAIFSFYQQFGKLRCPQFVSPDIFVEECEFFLLPRRDINLIKRQNGILVNEKSCENEVHVESEKRHFWTFLENPSSSRAAMIYAIVSMSCVLIAIGLSIVETVPLLKCYSTDLGSNPYSQAELFLNLFFLLELVFRLICCPSKRRFFKSFLNLVDIIAVIPYFLTLMMAFAKVSSVRFLRNLRLLRILRMSKFTKYSVQLDVVTKIIIAGRSDISLFVVIVAILVMLAGSIGFYIEGMGSNPGFQSIPESLWWGMITVSTVGYGDVVPVTTVGKIFAGLLMGFGSLTMIVPSLAFVRKFELFYKKNVTAKRHLEERKKSAPDQRHSRILPKNGKNTSLHDIEKQKKRQNSTPNILKKPDIEYEKKLEKTFGLANNREEIKTEVPSDYEGILKEVEKKLLLMNIQKRVKDEEWYLEDFEPTDHTEELNASYDDRLPILNAFSSSTDSYSQPSCSYSDTSCTSLIKKHQN